MESEKETEMSQEADDSSCREEYAADKGWAQEAAASDQGDQGDHWITVSSRRRRQASTQEDTQVTSDDHWAGPGRMSDWDIGPPPTPEFHFLIVFAGNSNSTIGTKRSICV